MRNTIFLFALLALMSMETAQAQVPQDLIENERERAAIKDALLKERFETLLPQIMKENEVDMWVLISREYNEDPVLRTMLPANWMHARRRTILVFNRDPESGEVERKAIARYAIGENIESAWDKEAEPDQWKALSNLIVKENPRNIAIDISEHFNIADGLVHTDHQALIAALPDSLSQRLVSAEDLCIAWIETRTESEMKLYKDLVEITHSIIDEAFSTRVIEPGVTTTEDVVWFMRDKVTSLGLEAWFHPTVDIQRSEEALKSQVEAFSKSKPDQVIRPGDLLHCDFGITYLGLNTDCQQHAYIAKGEEKEVPAFLQRAFAEGNRVQDIFTSNFKLGRTGNEILLKSLQEGKAEGLRPAIYTHPLGSYGHSAGTTLGMWDAQEGVPFTGDYPMHFNTVYAIELNTTVYIDEWNKDVRIMLEEAGFFGEQGFRYVNGRQEGIKLIR